MMNERDADLLRTVPLKHQFNNFLMGEDFSQDQITQEVKDLLSADIFLEFLTDAVERNIDDESNIIRAINRFALATETEFIEPTTNEDEYTKLTNRVETEISTFIWSNGRVASIDLLKNEEVKVIEEIYNVNNLLAFAKELSQNTETEFTEAEIDKILRYRNVLNQLNCRKRDIALAELALAGTVKEPKIGARTWGGDLHPYGFEKGGVIDGKEFSTFMGVKDDPGVEVVEINGEKIKIAGGRHESL